MSNFAIVGTRHFEDYQLMNYILSQYKIEKIVSGGAKGADTLAERYAKENDIPLLIHKPNWNAFGKSAGPIRNEQIVKDCDILIAFWDGKSKGTENTIKIAEKQKKIVKIINFGN